MTTKSPTDKRKSDIKRPLSSPAANGERISRLLVANRGEIACRIMRTCRAMGIAPLAIHSEADAYSMHVRQADLSACVGGPEPRESYLNMEAVLEAAKKLHADAIHPGYGFLSENAEFAARVHAAGMRFIGPSPEAMRLVGDKISAKREAAAVKVPMAPNIEIDIHSPATSKKLDAFLDSAGLPLIVKASGGGGGRGMRKVFVRSELPDAIRAASREAETFFKNPNVFCEKLIQNARHIEVQIIGDMHGNVLALSDRDCTMQRNHQKVLEEAPAPHIEPAIREAMHSAAVRLMQRVKYSNAGTVEFLLDTSGAFYFLEVNSRLQVEHPVTEAVLGIDLVQLQIAIAQGAQLKDLLPRPIAPIGHAIELRLCAENPENNFAPSSGYLSRVSFPSGGASQQAEQESATAATLRVDTGFGTGDTVPHYYDSLLAKLIVHAPGGNERETARLAAIQAASRTYAEGVRTNRRFLLSLLSSKAFKSSTHHIQSAAEILQAAPDVALERIAAAAAALSAELLAGALSSWGHNPWGSAGSNNALSPQSCIVTTRRYVVDEVEMEVIASNLSISQALSAADSPRAACTWSAAVKLLSTGAAHAFTVHGQASSGDSLSVETSLCTGAYCCNAGSSHSLACGEGAWVHSDQSSYSIRRVLERLKHSSAEGVKHAGEITSHLPGKILDVKVKAGDTVKLGTVLVVLESMKMEHRIEAPMTATVSQVSAVSGQTVQSGQVLAVLQALP